MLQAAREAMGYKRLGSKIRAGLESAARSLCSQGLLAIEEGEWFLTPAGREATLSPMRPAPAWGRRRPTATTKAQCRCGGRWVLRSGAFGSFYGCSRYPRCRATRAA